MFAPQIAKSSDMMDVDTHIPLKVVLTEEDIHQYVQPLGTRECGTNCTICVLQMMKLIPPDRAILGTSMCIQRQSPLPTQDVLQEGMNYLLQKTGKHYQLYAPMGVNVLQGLSSISSELNDGEAGFFLFGTGRNSHAVILCKTMTGELELIDPQRGNADLEKPNGFTRQRATELKIQSFDNCYRVKGEYNIVRVMIEQALKFRYAETEEDLIQMGIFIGFVRTDTAIPKFGGRRKTRRRRGRSLRR